MRAPVLSVVLFGALCLSFPSGPSYADDEDCELEADIPIERQLRRLSVDLRGVVPDYPEYEGVAGEAKVPEAVLEGYLASDEFRLAMRRYHEDLLWTNPSITVAEVGFGLSAKTVGSVSVLSVTSSTKRKLYRGGDGTHICQDKPQADLGYTDGSPNVELMGEDPVGPFYAEGWVEVLPYWETDATKKVKVCAFDAQTNATYTIATGSDAGTYTCDHQLSNVKECGCGPSLDYCVVNAVVQPAVLSGMREQLLKVVDDHTVGGQPYSQILTTKRSYLNGPLTHYFKHLAQRQSYSRTQNTWSAEDGELPDLAYTDATWVETTRSSPHAGILTLPAYLLRYQTNRGRANRFRIAFLGQYFEPPNTLDTSCKPEGDDLTDRCVCRGCHVTLEPLAAHFGRFAEAGSGSVASWPESFDSLTDCKRSIMPSSQAFCDRFYSPVPDLVDPDIRPYKLKALRYADPDHEDVRPAFDEGPEGLAAEAIEDGTFHSVATIHLFEYFMKRAPNLDSTSPDYEGKVISSIAEDFAKHDDFKQAVRAIVSLPAYRQAGTGPLEMVEEEGK